jgi:hypothetical protein
MTARAAFAGLGKNFMTPDVIAYRWATIDGKRWAVELSEGTGFDHQPIYGVSFRDPENPDEADLELSRMFHSREEAEGWYSQ